MKKIFKEWGGIVVVVIAVVALIGLVSFLMKPGGVLSNAFSSITNSFVGKTKDLVNKDFSGPTLFLDNVLSADNSNPTLVDSGSFVLSGKASDDSGIKSLTVNGSVVTVKPDGTWSITLSLMMDEVKEIIVVATDNSENTNTQIGYVKYVEIELVALTSEYFEAIGYDTTVANLVIPATFQNIDGTWCKITSIGEYAFKGHTNLTSVKIPEGVTKIDSYSFYGCTGLTSIGPVGSGASVELPNSLTRIRYSAFNKCSMLTSILVPRNVQQIDGSAFEECSLLADVKFEENSVLTNIYEYAFSECPKITSVGPAGSGCDFEIPNSLTNLYREVFSRDTNITKFIIPDNIVTIDPDAFAMLTGLQAFEVSSNHTAYCAIDGVLYTKDMKTLVRYPSGRSGSSFTVPAGVTTIGKYAFEDSTKLRNIILPSRLTTISYYAFAFCYNLETITIPASVTYISSYVFYNCYNMETAVFENTNGWSVSKNGVTTDVVVTDTAANAQNFRYEYLFHTWSRS